MEILVNEPYSDGPGAGENKAGQFTHKVRHYFKGLNGGKLEETMWLCANDL